MLSSVPFIATLPDELASKTASLFTVHGRYGNNALNGDWELGITSNSSAPPQQQSQRTWGDGLGKNPETFTFTVQNTLDASFTVGGSRVAASYASQLTSYEPNAIKIWARSTTTGSGVTIKDLSLLSRICG
jgi:hypothetical protein